MNETGMDTPQTLISLREVGLILGRRRILSSVTLDLKAGEILTIIGPNGAGKTSLVKVALGLLKPQEGRVIRREGLKVGYVPQQVRIEPILPLTVSRFLTLGVRAGRDHIREALERVGAETLLHSPVQEISGGEFRRVLLARALLRDVDLLVLDEPTQGVDVVGQPELYKLVAEIRAERGCCVLIVSHDLHLVMAATDEVVCLDHRICCHGAPESVSRHPAYRRLFGEPEARQLAIYSHDHSHDHTHVDVDGSAEKGE